MFFFVLTKKEKKHLRWIFFEKKEERRKAHTGRLQSFVFLCASPKKRVERLNPKRQRQKFLSPEDRTKKK